MSLHARFLILIFLQIALVPLSAQHFQPPAASPLAQKVHPRLFFTPESFAEVARYIRQYEMADFQKYIAETEQAFVGDLPGKDRNYLLLDAKNLAFLCYAQASGQFPEVEFLHPPDAYAQRAFEHAREIHRRTFDDKKFNEKAHCNSFGSGGEGGYINLALALVYDWCYDYLSLPQKRRIADALIEQYRQRDKDVNPGQKIKLGLTLLAQCHQAGVGGLTFWGDPLGPEYRAIAQEMLDMTHAVWVERVFEMGEHALEGAGGWSEGANYFSGGSLHCYMMAGVLSSALGENFFAKYRWLGDLPRYLFFYQLPMKISDGKTRAHYSQRNDTVDIRDWSPYGALQMIQPVTASLKTADPQTAGFYRWIVAESRYRIDQPALFDTLEPRLYWLFFKFLWGTKDVPLVDAAQFGLQTSYRFGLGDVILLSDWHSEAATKINFYTPTWSLPRHADEDNGAFVIFKYGTLALDAGIAKGNSKLPKSEKTRTAIYHNKLVFYQPGARGAQYYGYSSQTYDGADSPHDPANQWGGHNQIGEVKALRFAPGVFDFVDYDYTRAYKGESYVTHIRRALLYFRDPSAPDYSDREFVLIFDDAEVSDPSVIRRWLLHTPTRPQLHGTAWQPQGDGFWLAASSGNAGEIIEVTNTLLNAHGKLFAKILAPSDYQLRLRGGNTGKKYFWFTDAEGGDLTKRGPFDDWGAFWAGTHRLEVEDRSGGDISNYLVVLQIGDARTLNKMAPVEKIETPTHTGALINRNRLALINRSAAAVTAVSYSLAADAETAHVIAGLKPGKYSVMQNGNRLQDVAVASDGVLYFTAGGGQITVTRR